MKKILSLVTFLTLLAYSASFSQTAPGAEITSGNVIYSGEGGPLIAAPEPPENRGALKLKLSPVFGMESALLLDQYDIQSTRGEEFGGTIFMQDQGGCLVLAGTGTTEINYLMADDIEFDDAIQTKASGEIAYGSTNKFDEKQTGSSNWSLVYNGVEGYYEITINNESYSSLDFSTTVTPHSSVFPLIANTLSLNNKLIVKLYKLDGTLTRGSFAFSVNKYQMAPDMEEVCVSESEGEGLTSTSNRRRRNLK